MLNSTPCNGTNFSVSFSLAPKCGAKTRKGHACRSPAANGKRRCRMHGGAIGSGAPKGNKNALKHGYYSKKMAIERFLANNTMQACHQLLDEYE